MVEWRRGSADGALRHDMSRPLPGFLRVNGRCVELGRSIADPYVDLHLRGWATKSGRSTLSPRLSTSTSFEPFPVL